MSTSRKSKNLRLTEQDFEIIARLQQHYGIASQNEVIRMALRAALRELPPTQAPNKDSPFLPRAKATGTPGSEG